MNEIEQNAMNDDRDDEVEQLQEPKRKEENKKLPTRKYEQHSKNEKS